MEGEEYGQPKFELGRDPFFEKRVLTSLARKMPKNVCHSTMHSRFLVFSRFGSSWSFLCVFPSTFLALASFFPWMGGRFCSAGDWVFFLAFLGAAGALSIHVFVISCDFTMAGKSHSRFLLSQRLLASRTGYLGHFSPAVSWSP